MRHIRTFVGHLSPKPEQRNIMVSMRVPEIHGFVDALRKAVALQLKTMSRKIMSW